MTAEGRITKDSNLFPLVEPQAAPEIFVDGFQGVTVTNGVAKLNCFSIDVAANGSEERRIVLRLACHVGTMDAIQTALARILQEMKDAGVIREVEDGKH